MSDESNNSYAMKPLCSRCHDVRFVTKRVEARGETDVVKCPACGPNFDKIDGKTQETTESRERYENFRRVRWAETRKPPEINVMDLTNDELKVFKTWQTEHPNISKMTLLTWIEGRRYDPTTDVEFLEIARQKFKEWRKR